MNPSHPTFRNGRRSAYRFTPWLAAVVVALSGIAFPGVVFPTARAEVVVLCNRTPQPVAVTARSTDQKTQQLTIDAGDSRPIFYDGRLRIRYQQGQSSPESSVQSYSAYCLSPSPDGGLPTLERIALGEMAASSAPRNWKQPLGGQQAATIPVKILVDDNQPTRRAVWEPRLRQRIDRASQILQQHSGIRLKVVAIDTWDSDDRQRDFFRSLGELEREVPTEPARLVIGFTSQYRIARGRVHMGGTRSPLHSHILLKEYSPQVGEDERLELLVHELGHFLGAAHSPEPTSVMRPVLSGGLQRHANAHVQFDPVNTLLVAMTGEEIRRRHVHQLTDLSLPTKRRMKQIYTVLDEAFPEDPAAGQYARVLGASITRPLIEDTQKILRQIVRVAELKGRLEDGGRSSEIGSQQIDDLNPKETFVAATTDPADGKSTKPVSTAKSRSDTQTEFLVRQAALAAGQVHRENAEQAFLLALGIAMDDTGTLRSLPGTKSLAIRVESEAEVKQRITAIQSPTMRGRADLTRHFFASGLAVVMHGSAAARGGGLAKELIDAQGGNGFSFADMTANRAGIVFAHAVLSRRLPLERVADEFTVERFLPPVDGLPEGLTTEQMRDAFGSLDDPRFQAQLRRIEQQVMRLPAYRP